MPYNDKIELKFCFHKFCKLNKKGKNMEENYKCGILKLQVSKSALYAILKRGLEDYQTLPCSFTPLK